MIYLLQNKNTVDMEFEMAICGITMEQNDGSEHTRIFLSGFNAN